jgi:hypothetical protein
MTKDELKNKWAQLKVFYGPNAPEALLIELRRENGLPALATLAVEIEVRLVERALHSFRAHTNPAPVMTDQQSYEDCLLRIDVLVEAARVD